MAYNAQTISPIDFKPSVGVGVSLPFNGKSCFNTTFTTQEAIKSNLINWFLTNQGERPLNPNFGGNLRQFLFQQISEDTLEFLEEDIQSQLGTYFPSVIVENLEISTQPDRQTIDVLLKYSVQSTSITDELNITFD
jgi:phage baseplate assembly protein W|tara:strand:- start:683 stop:1090 length:408 start_codon:yes stop_codon:yes gene_type:complete